MSELSMNQKHVLRLIRKDGDEAGWAPVSKMVMPIVKDVPHRLIEVEDNGNGGRARLTAEGNTVLDFI